MYVIVGGDRIKKIIFLFILCFIILSPVKAKDYYSEYSDYSEYRDEKPIASDTVSVKKKTVYRGYKIEKEYIYSKDNIKNLKKTGNTKEEIINLTEEKKENDNYEEVDNEYYKKPKIKSATIVNKSINSPTTLNYFSFTHDKEIIYLNNWVPVGISKSLNITFDESYFIDEIHFCTYFLESTNYNLDIILIDEDDNQYNVPIARAGCDRYEFIKDIDYTKYYAIADETDYDIIIPKTMYGEKIILDEYEKEKKIDLNEYFEEEEKDDIYLDKKDKKILYSYKTRDKISIKDRLIIDNQNDDLNSLITSNESNLDIKVVSNIDYNINGVYDVIFILPFKQIKDKVVVDIKENYISLLKKQNDEINILNSALEESNYKVNKQNEVIKEVVREKEINNEDNIIKYDKCIGELEKEKNNKKEINNVYEKEDKKQVLNSKLPLICLSVIFLISILFSKKFF